MSDQPVIARRDIALPAARHHRVALLHQEAVSGVLFTSRIIASARANVEDRQRARVAAIYDVIEDCAIAVTHVDGLQDQDIGAVLHALRGIQRRLVDVHDPAVQFVA
jgi:hypothetical protein